MTRIVLACAAALAASASASAQNCAGTATGRIPITDLGPSLYLNQFQGGLYPGGLNTPPSAHAAEGLARAQAIAPLDTAGQPSPSGKYVMVSIGMSNTTQEFCSQGAAEPCDPWTFMGRAANSQNLDRAHLVIVNGARGGQAASSWDQPTDPEYNRVRDQVLAPRGLTEAQVQIGWIKQANPGPSASLPAANADAYQLTTQLGNIVRAMRTRYPNLRMVFLSSRIYAGYATTGLNPEPYAYETAFSVKWVIEAQINQMNGGGIDPRAGDLHYAGAPWLAWGPYLWADGLTPRSDGLTWACNQFTSDGTHPAPGATGARSAVGQMLHEFFRTSPFATPWFLADGPGACYANCDASTGAPPLNVADFSCFLTQYAAGRTYANCDNSTAQPLLNVADFSCFLQRYAGPCP